MIDYLKVRISPVDAAKAFAHSGSDDQSKFINMLGYELYVACKGDGFEFQCCWISDELDDNGIRLIKELHEFILLREQNKPADPCAKS